MKIPVILQAESAECSLACLAMVASAHGLRVGIRDLRSQFSVSSKGSTLSELLTQSTALGFNARPLRINIDELGDLKKASILHWRLNHFVVFVKCARGGVVIIDPCVGERKLSMNEFSECFTGVVLELSPAPTFQPKRAKTPLQVRQLTGSVRGLPQALFHIFLVAAVLEIFALAAPLFNQIIVDEILSSGDKELLNVIVFGFGILLLVQSFVSLARSWMVMSLGQTIALQWNSNMFAHLVKLPVSFFARRHLGDITSRFGSLSTIQKTLTTSVIEALLDGIMAVAALIAMFVYSWQLASMTVVAVFLYVLLRLFSYRPFKGASAQKLVLAAQQNSHFLETLRAITPIKLFGREEERKVRWQNLQVDVQNRDIMTAKMNILYTTANALIFGIENLAVFWCGARLVMATHDPGDVYYSPFTVGMLFAYVSYKMQFTQRVSSMVNYSVDLRMLNLQSDRLADIALSVPEQDHPEMHGLRKTLPFSDLNHLSPSLKLQKVSFRYGDSDHWILRDADLHIEAGKCVAIG